MIHKSTTKRLGEQSQAAAAPQVQLEQAVAGGGEALGDEGVAGASGPDVGNAPAVDGDLDRGVERLDDVRAVHGGPFRGGGARGVPTLARRWRHRRREGGDEEE
jgi:hypothetical protein